MKRSPLLLAGLFALIAGLFAFGPAWFAPAASAVSPAQVSGVYVVRLSGEAWARIAGSGAEQRSSAERVKGGAFLIVTSDAERNDGKVSVEIRLDRGLEGSVLDRVTGSPDFVGSGVIVGDRLTLIDSGSSIFVNAMDLRFERDGRKLSGSWLVSWPAASTEAAFVGGARVDLKGKRFVAKPRRPVPDIPPVDAASAVNDARSR
jgi:hypothetical protein